MPWVHETPDGLRETVAIEVIYCDEPVGWVYPDDVAALHSGDLDEQGILTLARLMPNPPAGTVRDAPARITWVDD